VTAEAGMIARPASTRASVGVFMLVRIAELTIRRLTETLVVPPKQQHAYMGLLT